MQRNCIKPKSDKGIYYTEDDIPVQTVYISGLSVDVCESKLIEYFSQFGKIESHRIYRNKFKKFAYAFITFATPEIAASVINKRQHPGNSRNAIASIADSWHQPKKQIVESESTNDIVINTENESLSLLMLNDDCLLCIFDFLNIFDLIHLSDVSTRLKQLMENNVFRKYSKLDLDTVQFAWDDKNLSLLNLRTIFLKMGPYVQSLHTSFWNILPKHDRVLMFIDKYCTNLEEMHLEDMLITDNNIWKRMSNGFPMLKRLNLKKCFGLDDLFMRLLPNLTELRLQYIRLFNGDGLLHLKNLEKLSIKYCGNLDRDILLTYLELNNKLKRLTLKGCTRDLSYPQKFQTVISNLKDLEYLCTDNLIGWPLEKLDGLKSLNAINSCEARVPSLRSLAEKDQLEELDLSWCCTLEDDKHEFHKYLLNFSHLKVVKLNYTDNIDEQLLLKLAAKLKLTHLGCVSVQLTEEAIVKLIELSDCLEWLYCTGVTVGVVEKIIDLLSRQLYRPKLNLLADIENVENLNIDYKRIQLLDLLPNIEDGFDDCDEDYDYCDGADDFYLAQFDFDPDEFDLVDYESDFTDYDYNDYEEFIFDNYY